MTKYKIHYCFLEKQRRGISATIEADDAAAALGQLLDDLEAKFGKTPRFAWVRIVEASLIKNPGRDGIYGPDIARRRKKKQHVERPATWDALPEQIKLAYQDGLAEQNRDRF